MVKYRTNGAIVGRRSSQACENNNLVQTNLLIAEGYLGKARTSLGVYRGST